MSNDSVYLSIKNCRKKTTTLCPYYKFPENVINQEELTPLAKGLRLWVRLFQTAFYTYVSMTQLLLHTNAYLTGSSFRLKAKLLPIKNILGVKYN